jgi:cupin fold WbuC family metalloprotein
MKHVDDTLLDALTQKAKDSPRRRMNFNLHPGPEDPVQRHCNAIEPGTYVRPHRHSQPETCEVFVMLRGAMVLLLFDDSGMVLERTVLSAHGPVLAAEIPPNQWHAMASLESGTVFFEVKQGPYAPPKNTHIASWSPVEGETGASALVAWYHLARPGDRPTGLPGTS